MSREALTWLNGLSRNGIRLKPTTWRILERLALLHRSGAGCYVSQARLADDANVSRGTVNTHLAILERQDFIARERRGAPARGVLQTTRYHLPFEPCFDRFKLPRSAAGVPPEFAEGVKASTGAVFVPPTVQELDTSFRNHTGKTEVFHPDQIVAHCLDACGPGLCGESRRIIRATDHMIIAWLGTGYSLEKDVLPTLRKRTRRVRAKRIRTWAYFTKAIAEAHHRRMHSSRNGMGTGTAAAAAAVAPRAK